MNPRVRVLSHLYRSLSSLQDNRDSQRLSLWLTFIESQVSSENLDSFPFLMKFLDSIEPKSDEQATQIAGISRKIAQLCLSKLETPSLIGDSRVIVERWEGIATEIATKNFRSGDDRGIEFLTSRVQSKNSWVRDGMMEKLGAVVKEAPGLAKELFVQLMIFEGESTDESVPFGSLALPMSTPKSSIEGTILWKGQQEFQGWLSIAPEEFTEAVLQITQHIVINKERVNNIKEEDFSIPLSEGRLGYIEDESCFWDSGGHVDYQHALIVQFQTQLDSWASSQEKKDRRSLALACETILSQNRLAVLWKRCLQFLAKYPGVFKQWFDGLLLRSDARPSEIKNFVDEVSQELGWFFRFTGGNGLGLFTAKVRMLDVFRDLEPNLSEHSIPASCQGDTGSRRTLLEELKARPGSVLLGLRSFWEGVDVAGSNLSYLVMEKLPFPMLAEPIIRARSFEVRARKQHEFVDYILPLMLIDFKQGFGRLIRGEEDIGAVLLLDKRVWNREYKADLIAALPGVDEKIGPALLDDETQLSRKASHLRTHEKRARSVANSP